MVVILGTLSVLIALLDPPEDGASSPGIADHIAGIFSQWGSSDHMPQPEEIVSGRTDFITRNEYEDISWNAFEELCALVYRAYGYSIIWPVRTKNSGADEGVDFTLRKDGREILAQCKAKKSKVGTGVVRDLIGAMRLKGVSRATLFAKAGVSSPAHDLCKSQGITVVTGPILLDGYQKLDQSTQAMIRKQLGTDIKTPQCPNCRLPMVARHNKQTKKRFWGCPKFPKCRTIISG